MSEKRHIQGYPNYKIDKDAIVYDVYRGRIVKPYVTVSGFYVNLVNEQGRKNVRVHKLIADAFVDNPNNFEKIVHIDGNKFNNTVENLKFIE